MAIITIPKILREKLTEEGAEALVEVLDKVEDRSEMHVLQVAEERFEKKVEQAKSELKDDINSLRSELKDDVGKVDKRLEQVRSELKTDIANARADLIKWMFIFWMGQVITITGILIAFLKK
ncbi:hypothetical protein [Candidatus Kuenenia sp.]|uniref:LA_3696 family protein n=1 Tax=Candidatus Kuenenia sp. TaxID=2499824 RepID=UPI00321FCFCC